MSLTATRLNFWIAKCRSELATAELSHDARAVPFVVSLLGSGEQAPVAGEGGMLGPLLSNSRCSNQIATASSKRASRILGAICCSVSTSAITRLISR